MGGSHPPRVDVISKAVWAAVWAEPGKQEPSVETHTSPI